MQIIKPVLEGADSTASAADCQVFKLLFKQHAPGIYRLAYSQLHSRSGAQDIVQECFLKFWEKRQTVSADPVEMKGYLYTSARHAILNQLRSEHKWVYQDYPEHLPAAAAPLAEAAVEYEELQALYSQALAHLPGRRQLIFIMSRQQGLSNASIAQELNISIKTVEAQMTQALKFIRRYFTIQGIVLSVLICLLWR